MKSGPPEISIIMPIRNEADAIDDTLASVMGQLVDAPLEIVIADGGSTDGTRELLEQRAREDGRIRLVDNRHGGIPQGLNAALRAARGRYVIRVDGHARVPPDFAQRLVDHLRAGRCEAAGGRIRAVGSRPFGRAVAAANDSRFGIGNAKHHYASRPEIVDHVPFGAYIRTRALEIGGWDESLVKNQDYEFDYRYTLAGGRVLLDPSVVSEWRIRETPGALARQYFHYGFWKCRTFARHPSSLRLRWLAPPTLVTALTLGAALSWAPPGRWLLACTGGSYALFLLVAALVLTGRIGLRLAPRAALALATMHLSWGSGFLLGAAGIGRSAIRGRAKHSLVSAPEKEAG